MGALYPKTERAGPRAEDVLLDVNGKSVTGVEARDLGALLDGPAGARLQLRLDRDGEEVQMAFPRDAAK